MLMYLGINNPANKTKIVELGALEPLVNMLRSGSDVVKTNAAGALWNLAPIIIRQSNQDRRVRRISHCWLICYKVGQMRLKKMLPERLGVWQTIIQRIKPRL